MKGYERVLDSWGGQVDLIECWCMKAIEFRLNIRTAYQRQMHRVQSIVEGYIDKLEQHVFVRVDLLHFSR